MKWGEKMDKHTHVLIDKDMHRELQIAAALKAESMINILRESFADWKRKQRIEDRINDFKR